MPRPWGGIGVNQARSAGRDPAAPRTRRTYAAPLPKYVIAAFEGYLACGDLARGFVRCHCDGCGHDVLVALSCKHRSPCPSCAARRMCNEAATLVHWVLPNVPLRQWAMSLPFELRALAATKSDVLAAAGTGQRGARGLVRRVP